jgi:hypothetical protein
MEGEPAMTRGKSKSTLITEQAIVEIVDERAPITVRGVCYAQAVILNKEIAMENLSVYADNSDAAQCLRLLDILRMRAVDSREARAPFGINKPLRRVQELRKQGHRIVTIWRWHEIECGVNIRVSQFVLLGDQYDHK